jgi:hypothetical protein
MGQVTGLDFSTVLAGKLRLGKEASNYKIKQEKLWNVP